MKKTKLLNYRFWIDFLFPNRCAVCNKVILWNELVCNDCLKTLPFTDDPFSASVKTKGNTLKKICCAFIYKDKAVSGIYNLKFNKAVSFSSLGASYCCEHLEKSGIAENIDAVTFVPMSKRKKNFRGYNQAKKIAVDVAKKLEKPIIENLLIHKSTTPEQHKLNYEQRIINAKLAFDICPGHCDITGKNILLCDDVITTGATMNKCAELLIEMGAGSVFGAAICTTESD